jgi:hypothetical protein
MMRTVMATGTGDYMGYGQYSQNGPATRSNPLAGKPKTKRQKQVFPSSEIPHLWAHQTQDSARNAQGNLYFDNGVIYSYGSHFPIARHVTHGRKSAVLFSSRRASVTTSGHQSAVRSSIPSGVTVFTVPSILFGSLTADVDHRANIGHYQSESKEALGKAERGRKYGEYSLREAFSARESARAYAKFFGLKTPDFSFLPKGKKLATLRATIAERTARAKVADAQADARAQARRAEEQRIRALEMPEKIEAWRAGNPHVDRWALRGLPVMLRIKGREVETSLGVRVPIEHAARALKFIRACVSAGREYVRNGHTEHIGHYSIDKVTADGTLHAGCHVIPYAEIELLAPAVLAKVPAVETV